MNKLRNKVVIEPEYFETVTIAFSDLPGFVTWVATATPYEVIALLNTIYTIFDEEIRHHELVQKIETISDCYVVSMQTHTNEGGISSNVNIMKVTSTSSRWPAEYRFGTESSTLRLYATLHSPFRTSFAKAGCRAKDFCFELVYTQVRDSDRHPPSAANKSGN